MVGPTKPPMEIDYEALSPAQRVTYTIGLWMRRLGRMASRIWVVALLVAAAMGSGVALNQFFQAQMQLEALRREPGPDAYAIVAYKRELERQLEAYGRERTADAVPQPPVRPRLLEEIDIARARNQIVVSNAAASARAPTSTMPVVNAPN